MNRTLYKRWSLVLQTIIGVLLLLWVFQAFSLNIQDTFVRLQHLNVAFIALSCVCFIGVILLNALRYRFFLHAHIPLTYLIGVALVQNAFLTFAPWRLGELSYPLILKRDYAIPLSHSSTTILAIRAVDFAIVAGIGILSSGQFGVDNRLAIGGFVLGVGIGLFMLFTINKWSHRLPTIAQPLIEPLRLLSSPLTLLYFIGLALCTLLLMVVQSTLILHATGLSITLFDVLILSALGLIVALLPIHPPGGWGTMDTFQVFILQQLGYAPTSTLPAILAAHTVYTVIILGGGIIGWLLNTTMALNVRHGRG